MAVVRLEPSPRARLAAGVCGALAAMTARSPVAFALIVVLVGWGSATTRTSIRDVVGLWSRMWLLLGVAFVGGAAGEGSQGAVLPFLGLVVTGRGLVSGTICALRLALALASVRVFLLMDEPGSVARAVEWWLGPLRRAGVRTQHVGEALGLMIELLPSMGREVRVALRRAARRPRELGPALADIVRRSTEAQLERGGSSSADTDLRFSPHLGVALAVLAAVSLAASLADF
jgi:energy-coupling factor transporter transmembrane protein EcfT